MSKRRFKKILEIGILQYKDPYYQEFAAQMAFYLLMSIVPIVGLTINALGFFNITQDIIESMIGKYLDPGMAEYVKLFVSEAPSIGLNIALIAIAIWSASKAQFCMSRISIYTMTGGKTTGGYITERVRALFTILIFIIGILFSLIVLVYGQSIVEVIVSVRFPDADAATMWLVIRWPIAICLYFLLIAVNYFLICSQWVKFRDVIPGAIFASLGFLVVSYFYSLYIRYLSNQSLLYGSFATVVGLMLWFWLISWVIWIGMLLNKCLLDTREYK